MWNGLRICSNVLEMLKGLGMCSGLEMCIGLVICSGLGMYKEFGR